MPGLKTKNKLQGSTQPSVKVNPLVDYITHKDRSEDEVSVLIDRVLDTWCSVYGYKFMGKDANEFDYVAKRKGWEFAIRPFSESTLRRAVERVLNPGQFDKVFDWPPSPYDFCQICKSIDPNFKRSTENRSDPQILSNLLSKIDSKSTN